VELSSIRFLHIVLYLHKSNDRAQTNKRIVDSMYNLKARALPIASVSLVLILLSTVAVYYLSTSYAAKPAPILLDPKSIPKYVNQLVVPPVFVPDTEGPDTYTITMATSRQQILPTGTILAAGADGLTNVWGYQGNAVARGATLGVPDGTYLPNFIHSPSATFAATRGTPTIVKWVNNINVAQPFAVDPTLKWANPTGLFPPADSVPQPFPTFPPGWDGIQTTLNAQAPVPLAPHLHGAEVLPHFDGGPEHWWTYNGFQGPKYNTYAATDPNAAIYYYHNAQEANTLWYHDHALGMTRLNVMSGLAGYYLLREPLTGAPITTLNASNLDEYLTTTFQYGVSEIPIAIQDRTFQTSGEFWFDNVGINPTIHPYWVPEFFGNTIMVNGRVWPNLDVAPGWYRFRLLDGSNARFYTLTFKDQITGLKVPFTLIGTDGGFIKAPVLMNKITIAPGERADILIDFSAIAPGTTILLENKAKAPFPNGAQANPQTTGQIMQFTVKATGTAVTQGVSAILPLPAVLNPTLAGLAFPNLPAPTVTRYITLLEVMGAAGPVMVTINGQYYDGVVTETPTNGTTEEWVIINLTADTHPIHTHLVTFQLLSRQKLDAAKYQTAWLNLNALGGPPPFTPRTYVPQSLAPTAYLFGKATTATPAETAWKDTLQMHPGEVTTIRLRFTQQDGTPFPFDPTGEPGYVWHCHIIDHEDNEMMRPYYVLP
jgi:FtsP/CotA-like multicopper oxidase with cupredoxin domain